MKQRLIWQRHRGSRSLLASYLPGVVALRLARQPALPAPWWRLVFPRTKPMTGPIHRPAVPVPSYFWRWWRRIESRLPEHPHERSRVWMAMTLTPFGAIHVFHTARRAAGREPEGDWSKIRLQSSGNEIDKTRLTPFQCEAIDKQCKKWADQRFGLIKKYGY